MTVSLEQARVTLPDLIQEMSRGQRVIITLDQEPVAELYLPQSAQISKTDGVVGGDACIGKTRIPIWTLVQMKKLGRKESDLVEDFPGLTASDLDAAWQYYRSNTEEIDSAIAAEQSDV